MQKSVFFQEEQVCAEEILRRFSESPEQFRQETVRLCTMAKIARNLQTELEKACAECDSVLRGLETAVRGICVKLPAKNGFFSARDSEKQFYPLFCGLMGVIQAAERCLHRALLRMAGAERFPYLALSYRLRAELNCRTVLDCGENAEKQMGDLLKELETDRECTEKLLCEERKRREDTECFLYKTVPAFCHAVSRAADAEHSGEQFRSSAVSGLCGEFCFSVQRLTAVLEVPVRSF